MRSYRTPASLAVRLRRWRVNAWELWTKPHNAVMILLATAVMVQSRAWKIRAI